ncbi:MAG: hypothetical protein ACXWG8_15865 [Usitatibacter sp.]
MPAVGRLALLALAVVSLIAGVAGGLARLGIALPVPTAVASHGALMISGFLGTVIGLERAVALGIPLAFGAPIASGLGSVLLLLGITAAGQALWLAAPLLLLGASLAIVARQAALHTVVLAFGAAAWAIGNVLHWAGASADVAASWWFAFLVLTIAAERLEMARLMKPRPLARPLFLAAMTALVAGAAASSLDPAAGARAFGLALVALAAWLFTFDIARRTAMTGGFSRYAAIALLGGYGWLAVAGLAWAVMPYKGLVLRDAAIHALGLGFVFSMILAHAPLVVLVVARMRMHFVPFFYVPLAMPHLSLLLRLAAGAADAGLRQWGGMLNAATLLVFAATMIHSLRLGSRAAPRVSAHPSKDG